MLGGGASALMPRGGTIGVDECGSEDQLLLLVASPRVRRRVKHLCLF